MVLIISDEQLANDRARGAGNAEGFRFCPSIIHPTDLFCQGAAWKSMSRKRSSHPSLRMRGPFSFAIFRNFRPKSQEKRAFFGAPHAFRRNSDGTPRKSHSFQNVPTEGAELPKQHREKRPARGDQIVAHLHPEAIRSPRSTPPAIVLPLRTCRRSPQLAPATGPSSSTS